MQMEGEKPREVMMWTKWSMLRLLKKPEMSKRMTTAQWPELMAPSAWWTRHMDLLLRSSGLKVRCAQVVIVMS